jgi:biofilm PGA synthesis N-glycosyltransferase PgaC
MILFIIVLVLFLAYGILVIRYWLIWKRIPEFSASDKKPHTTISISVIIAARNEEAVLGDLLQALQNQTYPQEFFEVIVVDDHSTDKTAELAKSFSHVRLIQLLDDNINAYKKKAIEKGIEAATGELIVTTDADCVPPPQWLQTIAAFKEEKKAVFIAAPVSIHCNSSVLQVFQAMDFMVLQGITGAVVHQKELSMCNGANLAYERNAFYEVNGFSGIEHTASGDDMLLMYKMMKKYPGGVHYLKSKNAIVSTRPAATWRDFFQQRRRWAAKALKYDDKRIFPVLLMVFLFNLSFWAMLAAIFWLPVAGYCLLIFLAAKTLVELPLFWSVSKFFNKSWAVKWFFFFQPLHIIYTVIAAVAGQTGKYEWKGRRVK